jgi:hypothetical protein
MVDRTAVAKIHDGPSRFYNFVIAQDRNGPPLDQKTTNRFFKTLRLLPHMDIPFRWMVLEGLYSQRLPRILQAISQIGIFGPDVKAVPRTLSLTDSRLSSPQARKPEVNPSNFTP